MIKCNWIGEASATLVCETCHKELDIVSRETISDMSNRGYRIWCMDCDEVTADSVHPALAPLNWTGQWWIELEGQIVSFDPLGEREYERCRAEFWKGEFNYLCQEIRK